MLHIPFQFDILKIIEIFLSDILHFYKLNFTKLILYYRFCVSFELSFVLYNNALHFIENF